MKIDRKKIATKRNDPAAQKRTAAEKQAAFQLARTNPAARMKLATVLGSPVKKHLDYKAIGRQCIVVEKIEQGKPLSWIEWDVEEWYGSFIGPEGTSRWNMAKGSYETFTPFELVSQMRTPMREMYIRGYSVLERGKERLKQAIELREDLRLLSLFDTAAAAASNTVTMAVSVTQAKIGELAQKIVHYTDGRSHHHQLPASKLILNSYALMDMQGWNNTTTDEAARIELRTKGALGSLFGYNIYATELYGTNTSSETYIYCLSEPEFTGYQPMWEDSLVQPADDLDNFNFGFNIYSLLNMMVLNNHAVGRLTFKPAT